MNPRIETIAEGITREVISEHTHLMYDPGTQGITVSFQYRPNLYVNDAWGGTAGDYGTLMKSMADIAASTFGIGLKDPITGADLSEVSGAGIVTLIKAAFPALYDAAYQSEQATA